MAHFESSFWNAVCSLFAERLGSDASILTKLSPGSYIYSSLSGRTIFSIQALSPAAVAELKKIVEIPFEEASPHLRYRFSFWYRLAKWLKKLEDKTPPAIELEYSFKNIPNGVFVSFDEIKAYFYLPESSLENILPTLSAEAPLQEKQLRQDIEILYQEMPSAPEEILLSYHVDASGRLYIDDAASKTQKKKSKTSASFGSSLTLRAGLEVSSMQVPLFIRLNRPELEQVPGFFSSTCPIEKVGLSVHLSKDFDLIVSPDYKVKPEYRNAAIQFFDDYVFTPSEGFYKVAQDYRIPEKYRCTNIIAKEKIASFLQEDLAQIEPFITDFDPRLKQPKDLKLFAGAIETAEAYGKGWYGLDLEYVCDQGKVSIPTLLSCVKKKMRFYFSDAGLIDLSDSRFKWIKQLPKDRFDKTTSLIVFSTLELIRLHALDPIALDKKDSFSSSLLEDLATFHTPEKPNIKGFKSSLRPYQTFGLEWLWFLYSHGLSGLLCDEMGLGKTHQTMGLIAGIKNEKAGEKPLFLVVCPTSVLFHWQEQMAEFLPNLKVFLYHGGERNASASEEDFDVLITSYGLFRSDQLLQKYRFEAAIFDEIQIAKNHRSRIHASLLSVKAKFRLGLTGTPIENHLRELKSLFDIVLPGYMPADPDFRSMFIRPIEKQGSKKQQTLLSRLIKPFILRRKKIDVLEDLPEKTEEIMHCLLSDCQKMLYSEVLGKTKDELIAKLKDESFSVPYLHIFAVLTNLKQICNHPASYLKTPGLYKDYSSGKWDLFVELLGEARESGQKVVVFSQYLAMLDIFEEYLKEEGIGFASIRGETQDRKQQVHRFNHDPACEVFLGSLGASGLGINLTAGSVVIHYDRWWNAAKENQATDRVHRIGQTKGVQVFKLVTKGSFEERIDTLIAKKARLLESVVQKDEPDILKTLDRNQLIELLQDVDIDQTT